MPLTQGTPLSQLPRSATPIPQIIQTQTLFHMAPSARLPHVVHSRWLQRVRRQFPSPPEDGAELPLHSLLAGWCGV